MAATMAAKTRERLLVLVILICVGALAGDRLVLSPLMKMWTERAKQIGELQKSINRGAMLVGRERSLEQRWREMREQSRSRENSATEYDVLKAVGRWAAAGAISVTSLKPRWADEEGCRKLEITTAVTGQLSAIARFLYELEIDPQPLKVENVDLSARDNRGQSLTCEVRFTRLVIEEQKP